MSSSDAGKGDSYRPVNLKKYGETLDRVFGERDVMDFHKDGPHRQKKDEHSWWLHETYILNAREPRTDEMKTEEQ